MRQGISHSLRALLLFPSPERTERTIFPAEKIQSFLMRTAKISFGGHDGFHMVAFKKLSDLSPHFRIGADTRADPPFQNRFGIFPLDDRCHDFRCGGVVGAVQGNRADRVFLRRRGRTDTQSMAVWHFEFRESM